MKRRAVLVTARFLMEHREQWDMGYELITPEQLAGLPDALAARIEVIVCNGEALDRSLVEALPQLKLVACFSTGYADLDVGMLHARGIALTTAAGVNAHDVADHAIALLLGFWHGIPAADRAVREGRWREGLAPRPSLRGRRAGIVGLGRIGAAIAQRVVALGMQVAWWGPNAKPDAPYPRATSLRELAAGSDVLLVASRAMRANSGQIDAGVLAALGRDGLLVNVSRGFLVDEQALLAALTQRTIAGAALDVFADEPATASTWRYLDNVLLSPHIAGYTRDAGSAMLGQLRENVRRALAGEPLLTPMVE